MHVETLKFSVKMEKNSFTILNAKGVVNNNNLRFVFDKLTDNPSVLVNGKEITDYTIVNNKIIVVVPFANCTVTVK